MTSHSHNLAARAGRWSAAHRRAAILGWVAFVVAAVLIGQAVGFKSGNGGGTGESGRADAVLSAHFPSAKRPDESVLVSSRAHTVHDAAF